MAEYRRRVRGWQVHRVKYSITITHRHRPAPPPNRKGPSMHHLHHLHVFRRGNCPLRRDLLLGSWTLGPIGLFDNGFHLGSSVLCTPYFIRISPCHRRHAVQYPIWRSLCTSDPLTRMKYFVHQRCTLYMLIDMAMFLGGSAICHGHSTLWGNRYPDCYYRLIVDLNSASSSYPYPHHSAIMSLI